MIRFRKYVLLVIAVSGALATVAQPTGFASVSDPFSRSFLAVYKDASTQFARQKGKQLAPNTYACKTALTGCKASWLDVEKEPICFFDYGAFEKFSEAEAAMLKLSTRISHAFLEQTMIKYEDSTATNNVLRKSMIAEVTDKGFYGYNVAVEVVRTSRVPELYNLRLKIVGGTPTFYRVIRKNEPVRQSQLYFWLKRNLQLFHEGKINCSTVPGLQCYYMDSAGSTLINAYKELADLPDAKMEFENMRATLRAALGERFVYYETTPTIDKEYRTTFIEATDHEKERRRSMTVSIQKVEEKYRLLLSIYQL